jgi:hypothetical protein
MFVVFFLVIGYLVLADRLANCWVRKRAGLVEPANHDVERRELRAIARLDVPEAAVDHDAPLADVAHARVDAPWCGRRSFRPSSMRWSPASTGGSHSLRKSSTPSWGWPRPAPRNPRSAP